MAPESALRGYSLSQHKGAGELNKTLRIGASSLLCSGPFDKDKDC